MKTYDTVAEVVNELMRRGYTYEFRQVKQEHADWLEGRRHLKPREFVIDELHRFEGATDPADESIIFAISSPVHGVKGMLIHAYGAYADPEVADLVAKLPEPRPLPPTQLKPG